MQIEELNKFGIDEKIVREYLDKVKNGEKIIAVTGSFSSGKSTFINAFIGKENFLASSNIECTPVLVDLINESLDKIIVKYNDGREEEVDLSEENINLYTRDKDSYDKNILGLTIPCDSQHLSEKVHFIDTPGTSTPKIEQELITNAILKKSDIVLYVFDTAVSQADLDRIEFIKQYADQIIFIMTKMDEVVDGELVSFPEEKIERLVGESTKEICKVYDKPSILPISSKLAFKDNKFIEEIRGTVSFIAFRNNENKLKETAKKQLGFIFEERLNELREEIAIEEQLFYVDLKKINKNEEQLKRELENLKISNDSAKKELGDIIKEKEKNTEKKLSIIYDHAIDKVMKNIEEYEEITQEELDFEMDSISKYINGEIKKFLDKSIESIINGVYYENKKVLAEIDTDLGLNIDSNIKRPSIEEVVLENHEIDYLRNKIYSAESEVAATVEEINYRERGIEELSERLNQTSEKKDAVYNEMLSRGEYVAQYEEVVEEGYGSTGRRVGNILGEIADVALIAVPGVGPLKTADTVKDGFKLTEYAARSLKGASRVQRKTGALSRVLPVLEMLSLAKYTEELGGVVGEAIKPTKVIRVENEEYKNAWKAEENRLKMIRAQLTREENKINEDFENARISIVEAKNRTRKLQDDKKRAEEELARLLEEMEMKKEKQTKEQIKDHYKKEIEKTISYEFEEIKPVIDEVLGQVSKNTIVMSTEEFNKKIASLQESIERVCEGRDKSEEVLKERKALLNELQGYSEWIDSWIA